MQEVVKGSLVLALMQLPTKLQEAYLKKIHIYYDQVSGHGCCRSSNEVQHGWGLSSTEEVLHKRKHLEWVLKL